MGPDLSYFVFAGSTSNNTYNINDERILILMKNGLARDISEVEDALVTQAIARSVRKNYVCYVPVDAYENMIREIKTNELIFANNKTK